jgi:hypothetical protein
MSTNDMASDIGGEVENLRQHRGKPGMPRSCPRAFLQPVDHPRGIDGRTNRDVLQRSLRQPTVPRSSY